MVNVWTGSRKVAHTEVELSSMLELRMANQIMWKYTFNGLSERAIRNISICLSQEGTARRCNWLCMIILGFPAFYVQPD